MHESEADGKGKQELPKKPRAKRGILKRPAANSQDSPTKKVKKSALAKSIAKKSPLKSPKQVTPQKSPKKVAPQKRENRPAENSLKLTRRHKEQIWSLMIYLQGGWKQLLQ
eukprot:3915827-Alexandrium_andersonii.AAC.1